MSDLLTRLVRRTLGAAGGSAPSLEPRTRPLFAATAAPDAERDPGESLELSSPAARPAADAVRAHESPWPGPVGQPTPAPLVRRRVAGPDAAPEAEARPAAPPATFAEPSSTARVVDRPVRSASPPALSSPAASSPAPSSPAAMLPTAAAVSAKTAARRAPEPSEERAEDVPRTREPRGAPARTRTSPTVTHPRTAPSPPILVPPAATRGDPTQGRAPTTGAPPPAVTPWTGARAPDTAVAAPREAPPREAVAPSIEVSIGRIEVRAVTPAPAAAPRGPALSLDAYLERRDGGRR